MKNDTALKQDMLRDLMYQKKVQNKVPMRNEMKHNVKVILGVEKCWDDKNKIAAEDNTDFKYLPLILKPIPRHWCGREAEIGNLMHHISEGCMEDPYLEIYIPKIKR